jgi:hypothetical protein
MAIVSIVFCHNRGKNGTINALEGMAMRVAVGYCVGTQETNLIRERSSVRRTMGHMILLLVVF